MMQTRLLSSVAALALLAGCADTVDTPPQVLGGGNPAAVAAKTEYIKNIQKVIPDWYSENPLEDDAVFSSGVGVAQTLKLAKALAVLDAKTQLADRIDGRLDSRLEEFTTVVGNVFNGTTVTEVEQTTINRIVDVDVSGYTVMKSLEVAEGPVWRVFVQVRYPTNNNDVLAGKAAKLAHKTGRVRKAVAQSKMKTDRLKKAEVEAQKLQPIVVTVD